MPLFLSYLLTLCLFVTSLQAALISDITFTLNEAGTEYSVTDCNNSASGELVIEEFHEGLPVTLIDFEAFDNCEQLTSLVSFLSS